MALETDPIDLLLDGDGDLAIGQDVTFSSGRPAVAQSIRIAVLLVRGEWFLDDADGVPYWERDNVRADEALLGQPFSQIKAIGAFRDAIRGVPHVLEILSLGVSFDRNTRRLTVSWSVRSIFGVVTDSVERG